MNKKKISVLFIILTICLSICLFLPIQVSYADELTPNDLINSGMGAGDPNADIDTSFVQRFGGDISSYLFTIAIIISIIALSYVGVLYITGGITQKADYKKNLIPMGIGVFIIVFLATILKIIASAAGNI